MKLWQKILLGVVLILVLVYIIGLGFVEKTIKTEVEKQASKALGVPVTLGKIKLGLLTGSFSLRNLKVANPDGFSPDGLFKLDSFTVKVSYPALLKKQIVVNLVSVKKPEVNIEIQKGNKINAVTLIDQLPREKKVKKEEKPLPVFLVKKIIVEKARAQVADAGFCQPASTSSVDNVKFVLLNLTNAATPPKNAGTFQLTGQVNKKAPFKFDGWVRPFDKKMSFVVKGNLTGAALTDFAPYYQKSPVVIKSGLADLGLDLKCGEEILNGICSVLMRNLEVGSKESKGAVKIAGNISDALVDYLKDTKGRLQFDFKIGGTTKKPDIGFMGALNKVISQIVAKTAKKVGEKMVEGAKSKAIGEATKGIKIGF